MAEPGLSIANTGTGTAVSAAITASGGATVTLHYRKLTDASWTVGNSRVGDGPIPQGSLTNLTRYTFIAISNAPAALPSLPVSLLVYATHTAVIELLAQAVLAKLQELIVAGHAIQVERPLRIGLPSTPVNKALVMYQDDPREDEPEYGFKQWIQPFAIDCYIRPSDTDAMAVDTRINALRAEVEKKLREDYTFGGYALDARIRAPEAFLTGEGFEGVRVNVEVTFRHNENDPFSLT
jgi:hypothetical protein